MVLILDNGTTAMTGLQEHPGTGRTLDHEPTGKVVFEDLARALGVARRARDRSRRRTRQASSELLTRVPGPGASLSVIIARRPCLLAAGKIKEYETVPKAQEHAE